MSDGWKYSDKEYLKLYRKIVDWEWYSCPATKDLFIHCLIKANWKAADWHGIHMEPGEFIQSNEKIANETGLSVKQIRTAFLHLIETGEVAVRRVGKYRVITVKNYSTYQQMGSVEGIKRAPKTALKGHEKGSGYKKVKKYEEEKENSVPSGTKKPDDDDDEGWEDP